MQIRKRLTKCHFRHVKKGLRGEGTTLGRERDGRFTQESTEFPRESATSRIQPEDN